MCKQLARSRFVLARCLAVLVMSVVCGCGLVDSIGPRSVHYNDEMADSKSGTILLNIIRAAYSMPLQFTDLSQFTAGASVEGSIGAQTGAGIPVPLNALSNMLARTATVSPQIALGGKLNATSSTQGVNLNSQEFYKGLQDPLSKKQIHYYLTGNATSLEDWQLFSLFISNITVYNRRHDAEPKWVHTLYGRADSIDNFEAFTWSLRTLINKGLTMAKVPAVSTPVGPALDAVQASNPELLAALVTSSTAEKTGLTLTTVDDETEGAPKTYQLKRGGEKDFRFCFAPELAKLNPALWTERRTELRIPLEVPLFFTKLRPPIAWGKISTKNSCGRKKPDVKEKEGVNFETRSLEGIFYFLGEMVRTELGLGLDGVPTSLATQFEGESCAYRLFSVKPRRPSHGEIGVKYKGQWFSVEVDPSGLCNSSSRVLQILADLWALKSSAKDFPTSNVVTIANP